MNIKDVILEDVNKFKGLKKWRGCENFRQIREDTYKIFDINIHIENFIDIGACLGEVSYAASILFEDAKIISIEASPQTFKLLRANLSSLNSKNLFVENLAIDSCDCKKMFMKRMKNIGQNKTATEGAEETAVMSISFLSLLEKYDVKNLNKSVIKIDCEGCEKFILNHYRTLNQFYQVSLEAHENQNGVTTIVDEFMAYMQNTHTIIYGSRTVGSIYEIVFRKKP